MEAVPKVLFGEFLKENTRFESVRRWKNNLKGGRYESFCLLELADFFHVYNINPDELIKSRLAELKSEDMTIRCRAEDRLMAYYKKLAKSKPGKAINAYRKICSFYRYNFVRLQTKDPGYTVQRERDYFAIKEETRKMCELLELGSQNVPFGSGGKLWQTWCCRQNPLEGHSRGTRQ